VIIVRETTKWDGDYSNHIYVLSDDKRTMFGYVKAGTLEHKTFKKPIGFDPKGREFKLLKKIKAKKTV